MPASPWTVRGDLHVHASHSRCDRHKVGDPIDYDHDCGSAAGQEMRALRDHSRYEYLAIVNHATDPVRPQPPSAISEQKLRDHLASVRSIDGERRSNQPRLIPGVEASLLPDGSLDVSRELLCTTPLVIASRHGGTTKLPLEELQPKLARLFRDAPIHILGHPTRYVPPTPVTDYQRLLALCTEHDVAFELNERTPFGGELVDAIVASRVVISLGSDVHPELLEHGASLLGPHPPLLRELETAGLTPERVLNTWPLEKLQAWLARRRAMCDT